jgi:hypothetical protein
MKRVAFPAALLLGFALGYGTCHGQTAPGAQVINKTVPTAGLPAKPADPPAKITLPTSPEKDALLTAIHHQDQAAKEVSDLNQKVQALQMQVQSESTRLQAKQADADKAVAAARAAAFKAANLDEAKYTLDYETWEFTAKPEPKPAAENPAKK